MFDFANLGIFFITTKKSRDYFYSYKTYKSATI